MNNYRLLERKVLGGLMIIDPELRADYLKHLDESLFSSRANSKLFNYLRSGGEDSLKFAEILGDITLATDLVINGSRSTEDFKEFRKVAMSEKIKSAANTENWTSLGELLGMLEEKSDSNPVEDYYERKRMILENGSRDLWGFSTGLTTLDKETKGLQPKQIWVCGGYYGYGKTWVAMNMILHALKQNKKVMFFSLEMPNSSIIERLVSLECGLKAYDTAFSSIPEELERIKKAEGFILGKVEDGSLVLEESVFDKGTMVSRLISENSYKHVDFMVLDYIQLLSGGSNSYEELKDATSLIQKVTKEIGCSTLLLSQLNNETQKSGDFTRVDGFKGAGEIGQIADVAIKIARERSEITGKFDPLFSLNVTKNRHGEPCTINCKFLFPGGRIVETDEKPSKSFKEADVHKDIFGDMVRDL